MQIGREAERQRRMSLESERQRGRKAEADKHRVRKAESPRCIKALRQGAQEAERQRG